MSRYSPPSRAELAASDALLARAREIGTQPPPGWIRTDPRPWTKLNARWRHLSGWRAEHCGHATALWPWALFDPKARMVLRGAIHGRPDCGYAWRTLAEVWAYVERALADARGGAGR